MREEPDSPDRVPERAPHRRVYLSASNHFLLGLKTFGYMLVGYLAVGLVIAGVLAILYLING
jgi:hypothetical protein